MDAQLKRGSLDVCVLAVIQKEDSYGYKIIQDLEGVIGISESTLYPILKRLEITECLETYNQINNGRLRKMYRIRRKGIEKLNAYLEDFQEMMKIYHFVERSCNHE